MRNTFNKPIIPDNEELRLKALHYYKLIDTLPDYYFTNFAHILAATFQTPIALVSIVSQDLVYFKGNVGMEDTLSVERGVSLCSLAVLDDEPTIFRDAQKEPCLLNNPLVAEEFGLRFYAGAPITTPEGFHIGTVCVADRAPRDISETEVEILKRFAEAAMHEIEMRSLLVRTTESRRNLSER